MEGKASERRTGSFRSRLPGGDGRPSHTPDSGRDLRQSRDVTEEYVRGAGEALRLFEKYGCCLAIFKERSPSCGSGEIYDGSFSGSVTAADGIAAGLLKKRGACVYGESQAEEILELLFGKTEEGRKSRV